MSPPNTLKAAFLDPVHTLIYVGFIVTACTIFSKTGIEVSGCGLCNIAKQLKDQQMVRSLSSPPRRVCAWDGADQGQVIVGHCEGSMYKELKRVVPDGGGGAILGLLSVAADLVCIIGSGTGILMGVTIIYSYWDIGMRVCHSGLPCLYVY